jgi:excisionase family DNA binding protein
MAEEKLLTVRDVSIILGISEKEVVDLAESGAMPAYKIGGVYLRFKKEQIQEFRKKSKSVLSKVHTEHKYTIKDRISDFFYFNDFYLLALLIIFLLLFIILRGYSL